MAMCLGQSGMIGLTAVMFACGGGGNGQWPDAGIYGHGCWSCYYMEISAGSFGMGCHSDQAPDCDDHTDALPVHPVMIDAFCMMAEEVTQCQYGQCVEDGACTEPTGSYAPDCGVRIPVRNVTWDQADTFCRWAQARLPTEAEWEYAARGPQSYSYPWGNSPPTCSLAVYQGCEDGFSGGRSPFGMYQMAGTLAEWVADFYDTGYYAVSPAENPPGPETGTAHVVRGGSYLDPPEDLRTWVRNAGEPGDGVGFRCAVLTPSGEWPVDGGP